MDREGKKKKKKHTNIHRKRERGNWKASQQKCDGIDIVDLSFGRCCSASGCQTSHWYGCHGKSAGLVHARQKENLMCCHSWIGFILVLEIHSSNASTWEEWITPAICQLICRFPPSAAQTYRGFCPFFFFYSIHKCWSWSPDKEGIKPAVNLLSRESSFIFYCVLTFISL